MAVAQFTIKFEFPEDLRPAVEVVANNAPIVGLKREDIIDMFESCEGFTVVKGELLD